MPDNSRVELRKKAEQQLQTKYPNLSTYSPSDLEEVLHELKVHQIELEIQNEALRTTQLELDASHQQYFELFDNAPIGYIIVDENKKILNINTTALTMLNTQLRTLVNTFFFRLVATPDQEKFLLLFNRLIKNGLSQSFEIQLLTMDDTLLDVQLECIRIQQLESFRYCIGLIDITHKKQAEARKRELRAEKENVRILSEFLANTTHDLRTPLTSLVFGLDLLKRVAQDSIYVPRISNLQKQVARLTQMIEQMFIISAMDSLDKFSLKPEDVGKLVETVVNDLRPVSTEAGQILIFNLPKISIMANLDNIAFSRVMSNLIHNAIKFSPTEAIITIDVITLNSEVIISVADNGIGISVDDIPHIFERHYRTDKSRNSDTGGIGLGLAIVKKTVEGLNGRVEVDSEIGKGSTIRVILPLS